MNYLPYKKSIDKEREEYLYQQRLLEACNDSDKMRYYEGKIGIFDLMELEIKKLKQ